jgi:polyphosphate glucokinase
MQILVVDVGGTEVKVLVTGQMTHRQFASSVPLTPIQMVSRVLKTAEGWKYDAMSIGYPMQNHRRRSSVEFHLGNPG